MPRKWRDGSGYPIAVSKMDLMHIINAYCLICNEIEDTTLKGVIVGEDYARDWDVEEIEWRNNGGNRRYWIRIFKNEIDRRCNGYINYEKLFKNLQAIQENKVEGNKSEGLPKSNF